MKKKISRIIIAMMLVISSVISTAAPAFAAGEETWSAQYGPTETFRMQDTNLTKVKTMGRSGRIRLAVVGTPCKAGVCGCSDHEPANYSPVVITCKILSYPSGAVLGSGSANENGWFNVMTNRSLNAGEKIQIFFDVSSQYNPPGPLRKAHITYKYQFE